MKVTFEREGLYGEVIARWNPEDLGPGYSFVLRDGKWTRSGGTGNHPSARPDIERAWTKYLASLIVD